MARAPRARVPKTAGQGVSRLGYQKGYALGNRGGFAGSTEVNAASPTSKPGKAPKEIVDAVESRPVRDMTGREYRKGKPRKK
jgi:hypothetical protein